VIESVFEVVNFLSSDGEVASVDNLSSVRAIRVLRIARIFRIFRVARIVRFVRALRALIYSILCTIKSVMWAMLLLAIIIYVFALVFTQAVSEYIVINSIEYDGEDIEACGSDEAILLMYWGSLPISMFTLFKSIAGGISWDVVVQPLQEVSPMWVMLFFSYIAFTYMAVLNVVTAVFCQSAMEGAQHDHDMVVQTQLAHKHMYVSRIKELFKSLDGDGSGVLTYEELSLHLEDDKVKAFFESMDLAVDDAWSLFRMLAADDGMIQIEEFVDGVLRLSGGANSFDMAKLIYDIQWIHKNFASHSEYVELELQCLHKFMGDEPVTPAGVTPAGSRRPSVHHGHTGHKSNACDS